MKTSTTLIAILISLILFFPVQIKAQQSDKTGKDKEKKKDWIERMQDPDVDFKKLQKDFEEYWEGRDDYKGNGYKVFKRWEYINEFRILPDGKLQKPDHVYKTYEKYKKEHPKLKSASGTWAIQGPTTYPGNNTGQPTGMGRINAIAFHPTDGNTIFVGSPSGGVWKTTNHGTSWTDLSANVPTLGVSSILVHPTNPDIIYLGTGDRDASDALPMGVFKSTDGGSTWKQINSTMGNVTVGVMLMHPSDPNTILAATSGGIYKTTNGGTSWSLKASGNFKDIKFKPGDPTVVYAVKITTPSEFYRSTNAGDSWTQVTSGIPTSGIGSRMVIGVSAANSNYVYLVQIKSSDNTFAGLLRSTNSGVDFTTRSAAATAPKIFGYACDGTSNASQATYDLCITVDPTNKDIVYVGSINNWKWNDNTSTWTIVSHWIGSDFSSSSSANCAVSVHADQHWYEWNNGKLYVGNDGGVYYTADGGSTWPQITNNLAITQIYKIGQSATNANYTVFGCQDNGSAVTTNGSNFTTVRGGDGADCIIDHSNTNYCYASTGGGRILRSTTGPTGSYTDLVQVGSNGIPGDESATYLAPYMLHPTNGSVMFAGYKNVYRCDDVRAGTVSFSAIPSDKTAECRVLEQSPADVNILYVVRSGSLQRTDNANAAAGSVTWTNCALPGGSTPKDIEAHATDPKIVYAVTGYKVYRSEDKGANWFDISGTLPDLFINTIVMDKNSNEGLYIGNQTSVFYKNASMTDWALVSDGLPLVDIRELEIYYDATTPANNRIKAGTYGRGLWQSDLIEINVINPSNFVAGTVSISQINLKWTKNPSNNDVLVAMSPTNTFGTPSWTYSIGNTITGGGTVIYKGNASNFNHTSLSTNTTYYYKIWSVDGSNQYSAGLPSVNATTDCNTISTLPFTEDFAGASCFRFNDNTGDGKWQIGSTSNGNYPTVNLTAPYAFFKGEYGVAHNYNSDLISPPFNLSAYPNVLLQFKHLFDASTTYSSTATVYYSIDNGTTWASLASYTSDSPNPENVSLPVNAAAGQSQVKFKWSYTASPFGAFMWAVDDIQISDNSNYWTGTVDNDWFKTGNWGNGVIPTATTSVVIPSAPTNQPQINASGAVCLNLTIQSGASLTMNASTANTLSVAGDWTNNGTFTRGAGTVDFNGTNDLQLIKGSSTTDFNVLKVTKGAQSKILEATSLITLNAATNPLVLTSGTFKLSSASTIVPFTDATGASILSSTGLWNNGGTINSGAFEWIINGGLIRVSAGTINIGTAAGNSLQYHNNGNLIIEGGAINIAARFMGNGTSSTAVYKQTGGTLTLFTVGSSLTTRAPFEINTVVTFNMSGGTIVIQKGSSNTAGEYVNLSTTNNVTGGTLQIGNASTPANQTIRINSTVPIYNLVVNSTNTPTAKLVTNGLTVKNDVTINGGTLDANNLNLTVGGNWTDDGIFTAGTGTVTLNGTEAKTIGGSSVTTFNNLVTSNGGIKTISAGKKVTVNGTLTTNNLLTINSSALGNNGSLIVSGSASGNVTYNRYVVDNRWFITSAPVNVASGFNTLNDKFKPGSGDYDFAWYDESGNYGWRYFNAIPSALNPGQGYMSRLLTGFNNLDFTGALNNSDVSVAVQSTAANYGWNAVGNPYTSAIKVRGTGGFLSSNTSPLDENYVALYLWNNGEYKVLNNIGYTPPADHDSYGYGTINEDNVQAGQGFLVNVRYNNGSPASIVFNKNMQLHNAEITLKSGTISWPGVTLVASQLGQFRSTVVCFNDQMTTGLDIGYDAGTLSDLGFDLYTKLMKAKGNKSDFKVQALPDNQYNNLVIPIGMDVPVEGPVFFQAKGIDLPHGYYPVFEDKKLKTKIPLKTENDYYEVNLEPGTKSTGRFYLRFSNSLKSAEITENATEELKNTIAWYVNNKIFISGSFETNTEAKLFDTNGRNIGSYRILNHNLFEIPAQHLINGIYYIRITGENHNKTLKVPVIHEK